MKRAKPRRGRRRKPPSIAKRPRPLTVEHALLSLAREISAIADRDPSPARGLSTALDALAVAFRRDAPLPRALAEARLRPRRDKAKMLALAWAREQLRLALQEILERAAKAGQLATNVPPAPLAWIVFVACQALADEPPEAAADRLRMLTAWLAEGRAEA